jgi:hypothetical protein
VSSSEHAGILLASGGIDSKLEYGPFAVLILYHNESIDWRWASIENVKYFWGSVSETDKFKRDQVEPHYASEGAA